MHTRLSRPKAIELLVNRRVPLAKLLRIPPAASDPNAVTRRHDIQRRVAAVEAELAALTDEELQAQVSAGHKLPDQEVLARVEADERSLFFHEPHAAADIDHWSKAACWTLDEAVALSLGKAPEVVTWRRVEPLVHVSRFARQFERLRDLATRAVQAGQLFDRVSPGTFLGWAKRNEIPYPPELEEKVVARGNHIIDWKAAHDRVVEKVRALEEAGKAHAANMETLVDAANELIMRRDELAAKLDQAQAHAAARDAELAAATPSPSSSDTGSDAPLKERERKTMLKLIAAMAVAKYRYSPRQQKNSATAHIARATEDIGQPVSEDTVLKYLRKASELVDWSVIDKG
jgi:hypothetical protein